MFLWQGAVVMGRVLSCINNWTIEGRFAYDRFAESSYARRLPMVQLQYNGMLERFKDVPDPRSRPNRIYPWQLLWGLISAAMASACQTPAAIARWITEHRDELLAVLPPSVIRLPCESTIRRTLATVDASQLDAAVTTLPPQAPPAPVPPVAAGAPTLLEGQAIDGKTVRG